MCACIVLRYAALHCGRVCAELCIVDLHALHCRPHMEACGCRPQSAFDLETAYRMAYGPSPIAYTPWPVTYGLHTMARHLWPTHHGPSPIAYTPWPTAYGLWPMA